MKKVIEILKAELKVAKKEAESFLKSGNPCIELIPNNPYIKCEDLEKVIATLEKYDTETVTCNLGSSLRMGQEVWVRAEIHDMNNFGEYDLRIEDNEGASDFAYGIGAKDIVAEKPETISGKVLIEYNLDNGEVLNVEPVLAKKGKKEMYKVIGYDSEGYDHTYSAFCTEESADELVNNYNKLGDVEVVALNGIKVKRLKKKLI